MRLQYQQPGNLWATRLVPVLFLALRAVAPAQFTYATNHGAITITGYTGTGGTVTIPGTTNGLPVTSIGDYAFYYCASLTNITIPDSITSIGNLAFFYCSSLSSVLVSSNVTSIGDDAFEGCASLNRVTIGKSVTNIGAFAFFDCASLTNVTIPGSVVSLGDYAFASCLRLTAVYFKGNAPGVGSSVLLGDNRAAVYYLPGTTGWGATFGGLAAALWQPLLQIADGGFSGQPRRFGFTIAWASGMTVVVEASTNLMFPGWQSLQTNTLAADSSYFSDAGSTNFPSRYYRLRFSILLAATLSMASPGIRTNQFGFTISGSSNQVVVVEACTNLAGPIWSSVATNTLTSGSSYFSDPQWKNYSRRFYRLRAP